MGDSPVEVEYGEFDLFDAVHIALINMNLASPRTNQVYSDVVEQTVEQVLEKFKSSTRGLVASEAVSRINKYGRNVIITNKSRSLLVEFVKNFQNPLVLVLVVISAVSLILGDTLDGSIVLSMVILSVVLNFFQEHKASQVAEKLLERVAQMSSVIRDGKEQQIVSSELVVGDILVLNAGDLIAADARVIDAKDFYLNQSALTGESFPVEKTNSPIAEKNLGIAQLRNIIFAGTNVVTGEATAVVISTGINTQFGAIAKDLSRQESDNNFTLGVKQFSLFILRIVLLFVIVIFFINAISRHDFFGSLTFAIAVAVGLTPEFLPMIMSVTMANGAVSMSKKGVIVKKLTAIPTFGSMDILCTDKTGTITEDKIALVKYLNFSGESDEKVLEMASVNSWFQTGINNPLDEAIKSFKQIDLSAYRKMSEIPFDFERKRMSVIAVLDGEQFIITKGAPESIFEVTDHYYDHGTMHSLDSRAKEKLLSMYHDLSKQGYRVLALSIKKVELGKEIVSKNDEVGLDFLGFTAFLDPIKANAKTAIGRLESIGIEVKVITGDNELVTQKACVDAAIPIRGIVLGHQIDLLTDQELGMKAQNATIFARFSPAQKNRVICALKGHQHVVGYMGDGINDAPSLQSADVGVSVANAVDVAKETAAFILTNKSLMELADGVLEGRKIFGNTMKYVMMSLSSNFGNMFSVLGAVLFLPFLPMLPIQILLNNFLYDLSQLTLPSDNVDKEYLLSPKRWNIHFIRRFMLIFGPISSLFDFITFSLLFYFFHNNSSAFQTGWFMESLATQTLVIHVIRTRKLPFLQSTSSKALLISTFCIVALGWLIPYTSIGTLFGFVALPLQLPFIFLMLVLCYLVLVEIGKKWFYKGVKIA